MPENKPLFAVFILSAVLGVYLSLAGMAYGQFLPLTLAGSELGLNLALAETPPGGQPLLLLDCVFAAGYAFVLGAAARELAPFSATPAAGKLLSQAIWLGAAADIAENVMLLTLLGGSGGVDAALLRAASVLKFAIFLAACGWVSGAAWRAGRRMWAACATAAGGLALASLLPALLGWRYP